jgi:tetratricopeptide (TPR) repeat protein
MRRKLALAALVLTAPAAVACFTGDGSEPPASSDPDAAPAGSGAEALSPTSDSCASTCSSVDSLQALGEEVYAAGQIATARALFGNALDEARQEEDQAGIARSLTWLAQAAWRLGDYQETRRLGEEALAMKLRLRMEEELFRSYNVLGLVSWNESRLLDAVELFSRATEVAEAAGDSANLAKVRNNLALVQTSLGEFEEARTGFLPTGGDPSSSGSAPSSEGRGRSHRRAERPRPSRSGVRGRR